MDLNKYIMPEMIRNAEFNHATERMIYQFESNSFGLDQADRNIRYLADFYSMCGYDYFKKYSSRSIFDYLPNWGLVLPANNAIAFFDSLINMEHNMERRQIRKTLEDLLPYVLSCRGFVFGTVFNAHNIESVRPCDTAYITPFFEDESIYGNLLRTQAELKGGHTYDKEYKSYVRAVFELSRQRELIEEWWQKGPRNIIKERVKPWSGDINERQNKFWSFFVIFKKYSLQLAGESSESELNDICNIASFIFKLEKLMSELDEIAKILNEADNIKAKAEWLNRLNILLSAESNYAILQKISANCEPKSIDDYDEQTILREYIKKRPQPSFAVLYENPILDKNKPFYKFRGSEKKRLYFYRNYPVARWIDVINRGPKEERFIKILPFYFTVLFLHKQNAERLFDRVPRTFSLKKLECSGDVSTSKYQNAVDNQICHYNFYQSMIDWCNRYFPGEYNRNLCNAFYTYTRPHIVQEPAAAENHFIGNQIYVLQRALQHVFEFDTSLFPQYAKWKITSNDFVSFFFVDQHSEIKRIRRQLQNLITKEKAQEYKILAFLGPDGLGISFMPENWHKALAEWLSEMIQIDQEIFQYAAKSAKFDYAGNEKPADPTAYNLAQIEVSIQYLCCKIIGEEMCTEVLKFCKRILGPEPQVHGDLKSIRNGIAD